VRFKATNGKASRPIACMRSFSRHDASASRCPPPPALHLLAHACRRRALFIDSYFKAVLRAIANGYDVRGFYYWWVPSMSVMRTGARAPACVRARAACVLCSLIGNQGAQVLEVCCLAQSVVTSIQTSAYGGVGISRPCSAPAGPPTF